MGVVLAGFPTNIFLDDPQWFQLFTHIANIRFLVAMRFFIQSFDLYHYQSHNYVGFSFPCRLCLLQILAFLHMCKFVHRNRILVDWEAGSGHGGFKFAPYVIVIRLVAVMRLVIQLSQLHDYKLKWSL